MPRFYVKSFIKSARVPILQFIFHCQSIPIECDLSMSSVNSSYNMTKLFWIYSQLDSRVVPLVFFVRFWAKVIKITSNKRPSSYLTNFQLTMLVLNFLIRLDPPILPPINQFVLPKAKSQDNDSQEFYVIDEQISHFK